MRDPEQERKLGEAMLAAAAAQLRPSQKVQDATQLIAEGLRLKAEDEKEKTS